MAMKHFEGLDCLHYIGHEIDGSKIHIPKGIKICDCMFENCESIDSSQKGMGE